MMTICRASRDGMHDMEWHSTPDGGGYWACRLPGCDAVEHDATGHHGGHVALDTLFAAVLLGLLVCAIVKAVYMDHDYYKGNPTIYAKEATNAH